MLRLALAAGIVMGVFWPWAQSPAAEPTVTVGPNVNVSTPFGMWSTTEP